MTTCYNTSKTARLLYIKLLFNIIFYYLLVIFHRSTIVIYYVVMLVILLLYKYTFPKFYTSTGIITKNTVGYLILIQIGG